MAVLVVYGLDTLQSHDDAARGPLIDARVRWPFEFARRPHRRHSDDFNGFVAALLPRDPSSGQGTPTMLRLENGEEVVALLCHDVHSALRRLRRGQLCCHNLKLVGAGLGRVVGCLLVGRGHLPGYPMWLGPQES